MARMTGVIFSDLGMASSFMALEWVQCAIREALGFAPFPATLNVRPRAAEDAEIWQTMRARSEGVPLAISQPGFCDARLYPIQISRASTVGERISAAVLVPAVENYPNDKIEIVAPMRLKDHLGLADGDTLTLEFLN